MTAILGLAAVLATAFDAPVPSAPLDLSGAVQYALAHDPTVLAKRATLAQDEATFAKDHAVEFPQIAGTVQNQVAKSRNAGGTFQQFGLQQATVYSQNLAQVGGTLSLYNGSLAQIDAQQAKRQVEAARDDERRSEQQLAADVAAAWFTAVQKREAVRLAQGDLAYQRELLRAARAQESVGRVAAVDVLKAEVGELHSEANLNSANAQDADARENLAQRIGAPPDTAFALPAVLPEPALPSTPLPAMIASALSARSDVAAAQAHVQAARLADAAIDYDRRPSIQLQGAFGHQETPAVNLAGIPGVSRNTPGFWQIAATTTLTLPLIEYGARHAAHVAAYAQLTAAQATLATTTSGVETDVRQAVRAAETTHDNVAYAREEVQYGSESARIAQLQYRSGLISLTDATLAQQNALSAATDLVNAKVDYLNALVRLRVAIGVDDPVAVVAPGAS